jgi:hypothetical protein
MITEIISRPLIKIQMQTLDNFLTTGSMKNLIMLFALIIISSCVREPDLRTTCYAFENQTDENLVLEFWSYNSGQAVTVRDIFTQNGKGVFAKKCETDNRLAGPVQVYRGDSIVMKFNDNRKLTYLFNFSDTDEPIFSSNGYRREEGTNNFFWDVTEEDFNNAEPF